jgi:hypothetical protein
MSRNSRVNAEAKARKTLADAVAAYEIVCPAPHAPQEEAVLGRLKALSEAIKFRRNRAVDGECMKQARAFANIYAAIPEHEYFDEYPDPEGPALIRIMINALSVKDGELAEDQEALAIIQKARAALPALNGAVAMLKNHGFSQQLFRESWDAQNDFEHRLAELKSALDFYAEALEDRIGIISPPKSHGPSDPLRFLIFFIEVHEGEEKSSHEDIARVANIALGTTTITAKMVRGLRS